MKVDWKVEYWRRYDYCPADLPFLRLKIEIFLFCLLCTTSAGVEITQRYSLCVPPKHLISAH